MKPEMLRTALLEDVNRLACAAAQDPLQSEPQRAREALESLRFIDATEIARYRRDQWLDRPEAELIERLIHYARERLGPIPRGADPLEFTRADPGWYAVRERATEALIALDGFVDIGVPGWGHQYRGSHG